MRRYLIPVIIAAIAVGIVFGVLSFSTSTLPPDQSTNGNGGTFTPSPDHAITFDEAKLRSSDDADMFTVYDIAVNYEPSQPYEFGIFDCNDMAAELWGIYQQEGIEAYIVLGNLNVAGEGFLGCDHAWLIVFCNGEIMAVEAVTSDAGVIYRVREPLLASAPIEAIRKRIFIENHQLSKESSEQYLEGYYYQNPSDLGTDLGSWW